MDPRLGIIERRVLPIQRIIAVSGGKGGIGKSSVASALSLCLSRAGHRVGLLDLDFAGPCSHVILGVQGVYPEEDKGLIPPEIHGIKFMSITYFTGNNPSPLRGNDISNAIIELLAITLWGSLDYLILDMPPGIGDTILDVIRLIKKMEFLIVTTESRVAQQVTTRELTMLRELHVPIIGVIENMKTHHHSNLSSGLSNLGVSVLGLVDFDPTLEDALGNVEQLLRTNFMRQLYEVALKIAMKNGVGS